MALEEMALAGVDSRRVVIDDAVTIIGSFNYTGPLVQGVSYSRSEAIRLPSQVNQLYSVIVTSNATNTLYEHGQTTNNSRTSVDPVAVSAFARPDLLQHLKQ